MTVNGYFGQSRVVPLRAFWKKVDDGGGVCRRVDMRRIIVSLVGDWAPRKKHLTRTFRF